MAPRDELLLVIVDITSSVIRAGVGVHDLIKGPLVECATRTGRKVDAMSPYTVQDYLVGPLLSQAEAAGEEQLEIVHPLVVGPNGMQVEDWTALEAVLRYVFHFGLALPQPPAAHPFIVSIPGQLPASLVDHLYTLLFNKLFVPQLLIATRPLLAAFHSGVSSGIILDVGVRGEGTEVSVVHDSQTLQAASMRYELDEGHLDDWLALQLLLEDPTLPETLGIAPSESRKLADAMAKIVSSLKQAGAIVFHSTHFAAASTALPPPSDDAGSFDVAKQLASKKDVKGKGKKKTEAELESELIEVAHPLDSEAEPLQIGLARHKYLEPFFLPTLLADLAPSASPTAAMLNFTQYEGKETVCAGIQEVIGDMLVSIDVIDTKRAVWGALVVVSSGNVGGIKALGKALVPLLAAFTVDSDPLAEPSRIRFAPTPEYFSEFKARGGELGCYLGACILAKLSMADPASRLFVTKGDFTTKGASCYRVLDSL